MKIALVGFDPLTREDAPWDDPQWEIWGINSGHLMRGCHRRPDLTFRADRWFQIHPPTACDKGEIDWLARLDAGEYSVPTYVRPDDMAHWRERFPSAAERGLFRPYPIVTIRTAFHGDWLVNSFCLMAAFAIHERCTDLGFYGTECRSLGRELAVERAGITYWMGVARAMGIEVHLPDHSTLAPWKEVYGFDYWDEATEAARRTELSIDTTTRLNACNLDTLAAVQAAREKTDGR